jgi:Iap family predicted aminopeptidase
MVFLTQKKILRIMLGISARSSCRKWFKNLEILPIPSLCIYSLMLFHVDNLHYFQTNSSVHDINTRYKNQLYIPSVRLSAIQRGITYSTIKMFNNLPPSISRLKKDKLVFKSVLRKYLLTHVFYSIEEFVSNRYLFLLKR